MSDAPKRPELLGFGLANYRSFGDEGFVIRDPKRVNVLIGKNNAGKSNVVEALHALSRLKHGAAGESLFTSATDRHRRGESYPEAILPLPTHLLARGKNVDNEYIRGVES